MRSTSERRIFSSVAVRVVCLGFGVGGLLGFVRAASAAPCCGGASALPQLITGDDRAQVSASLSHGNVIGDAPPQGIPVFRAASDSERVQILRFDAAYLVEERLQVGMGLPIVRRSRNFSEKDGSSATGLGDLGASAAYEFLPQWTYSAWKPRGFVFTQITVPTGPSIYDASQSHLVDARGRGYWSAAAGVAFVKSWGNWDALASIEGHRSFSRTVSSSDGQSISLHPGWGASALLGGGFSPGGGDLRLGLSLSPVHEGAIDVEGGVTSRSEAQLVWNTSAQVGYLLSPEWSSSLAYTDQTLLGPARNVSLSRTVMLSLQHRWPL